MKQLRIHVERIVRPIRASLGRKNKMREELLSHLEQKAASLMEGGASESAACEGAIAQLGETSALRAELQAAVPALERLAYMRLPLMNVADQWFDRREGESAFRFALVRTGHTAVLLCVVLLALLGALWLGLVPGGARFGAQPNYQVLAVGGLLLIYLAANFVCYLGAEVTGLGRVMSRKTASSAYRKGAALCLFLCVNIVLFLVPAVLFLVAEKPGQTAVLFEMLRGGGLGRIAIWAGATLLTLFAFLSAALKFEHEQYRKWGGLEIDE